MDDLNNDIFKNEGTDAAKNSGESSATAKQHLETERAAEALDLVHTLLDDSARTPKPLDEGLSALAAKAEELAEGIHNARH